MGKPCRNGTWLYTLIDECVDCEKSCHQPMCTEHCAANCTAMGGHYYDLGRHQCIRCADLCGRHPQECSQYCLSEYPHTPTPPNTNTHTHTVHSAVLLPVSIPLLYSLMGLCVLVLLCILGLSLLVFLRTARKRSPRPVKPGPSVIPQLVGNVQQRGRDDGQEPLSACTSNPTESCECTHCFPDLRVPCRGAVGEAKLIYSLHQQTSSSFSSPQHSGTGWGQEEQDKSWIDQPTSLPTGLK
uniref:TACI cysteine-rich domain-containing protein n=1 Tax=Gadus morhua TaxID=8049 RepID=A0A8C5FEK7_GADMO